MLMAVFRLTDWLRQVTTIDYFVKPLILSEHERIIKQNSMVKPEFLFVPTPIQTILSESKNNS